MTKKQRILQFLITLIVYVATGIILEKVLEIKEPVIYAGIYFFLGMVHMLISMTFHSKQE
jgi:hypothetical protein